MGGANPAGTPIENRIDELRSLIDFLDPAALGPLFRFNREFYELDERGKPAGYRNLDKLHARIKPFLLRRRKADVETELPERTERNYFVPLSPEQQNRYAEHEAAVARLIATAKRRALTQQEQDKLMRELAMMRMTCDTNYILDAKDRVCPKLAELKRVLEECRDNDATKLIVFSEWERMLELVREACAQLGLGFAWHTGSVPQRRRRAEINAFKTDPACRVFLSTDSGSTGLNLQNASIVVNCDLPWNPAKLEQRIARAWRKHQARPVTVINLVAEKTIEHRMLGTLAAKQALADGVLDLRGDLKEIKLTSGRQSFLAKLQQLVATPAAVAPTGPGSALAKPLPADRAQAFCERARSFSPAGLVRCEERYPLEGAHSVLVAVVERDAALWQEKLRPLHQELFGPGQSDPLAPVKLEVIDRATDDAIHRLIEAGLLVGQTRASRLLHPTATPPPALTEAERQQAAAHRALAGRKLKLATLFAQEGFADETRPGLLAAILATARAYAVEQRLPEPATANDALLPPLAPFAGESITNLREFLANPSSEALPIRDALARLLGP